MADKNEPKKRKQEEGKGFGDMLKSMARSAAKSGLLGKAPQMDAEAAEGGAQRAEWFKKRRK